ncbi:MAG: hypothetical protein ACRDTT_12425, partial [Pseudonocardiaceae bacterium]
MCGQQAGDLDRGEPGPGAQFDRVEPDTGPGGEVAGEQVHVAGRLRWSRGHPIDRGETFDDRVDPEFFA